MKKFPVSNELSNAEFYKEVNEVGGVYYDGDQGNGHGGSPVRLQPSRGQNIPDFGGINFDNTQTGFGTGKMSIDDDMGWEKKNGVLINPTGTFKDESISSNGFQAKEVDIAQHIDVIGMPTANINHNSSDDCYGG